MEAHFNKMDLGALKRRETDAVEKWFQTFADKLYTFIFYRVGRDADLAAELVQETFVSAIKKIEEFDPEKGSMCTWLSFLSKNHISKALKIKDRERAYQQVWADLDKGLADAFARIATQPLPDELLSRKETTELVQMTLANIPDNYKAALKAHYYHKKSISEMAACLKASEGAVKTLLHRARKTFEEAFVRLDESMNPDLSGGEKETGA
jgi:RNA polymerase sigma-70 factor (ECF subfamily)